MGLIIACLFPKKQLAQYNSPLTSTQPLPKAIAQNSFYTYTYQMFGEQVFAVVDQRGFPVRNDIVVAGEAQYQNYDRIINSTLEQSSPAVKRILASFYFRFKNQQKNKDRHNTTYQQIDSSPQISPDIIKYFIFFYTAGELSQTLRQAARQERLDEIAEIVKILRPHLAQHITQQERTSLLNQTKNVVYKKYESTIDASLIAIRNAGINSRNYFASFFIVEKSEFQAKRGAKGQAWLTIRLDREIHHEFLVVKQPFCERGQVQLIFFPFFHYQLREIDRKTPAHLTIQQIRPAIQK